MINLHLLVAYSGYSFTDGVPTLFSMYIFELRTVFPAVIFSVYPIFSAFFGW